MLVFLCPTIQIHQRVRIAYDEKNTVCNGPVFGSL